MNAAGRNSSRGFTLIEAMMVIVIVGILAAIAAPSFKQTMEKMRAKGVTSDLYMALATARSEALKRNASVTLQPKSGGWVNGWQTVDDTGTVLEDHDAISGSLTIDGPSDVTYRNSGRITGGTTQFSVTGSYTTSSRCLYLDLSGQPTTKDGTC